MTSKLTRERLEKIKSWRETYGAGSNVMLPAEEAEELACIALAAMDSEPVAYTDERNLGYIDGGRETAYLWGKQNSEASDVALYRHAQPVPEKYNIGDATMRHIFTPTGMTNVSDMQAVFDRVEAVLVGMEQPAPVVPDDVSIFEAAIEECKTCDSIDEHAWNHGVLVVMAKYESCRAAMLQAGNHPAQSDCCPAQNSVNPAQGGNSLVIPDEMTSGQAYEIGYYYGDPVDVFARGANWMRQHIIDSTLAAAPQEVKGE
ncbi:hypothetical protein MBQ14_003794 [Klebsiella pneumoniae]